MKKYFLQAAVLSILALTIIGCNSSENGNGNEGTEKKNAVAPTISGQPNEISSIRINEYLALSVTATTTDTGSLSYQWYSNSSNATTGGTAITTATGSTHEVDSSKAGTTYYYVTVTNTLTDNGDGGTKTASTTSTAATVTVVNIENAQAPSITTQPAAYSVVEPKASFELSVVATAKGTLTYQWYSNTTNSSTGGKSISGATESKYTVPTATVGTYYYYCIIKNTLTDNNDGGIKNATIKTDVATVAVDGIVVVATVPTATQKTLSVSYSPYANYPSYTYTATEGFKSYAWTYTCGKTVIKSTDSTSNTFIFKDAERLSSMSYTISLVVCDTDGNIYSTQVAQ